MAPSVLHQSVSVLFVLLPCLLPLELPLQAADTRVWSCSSSSSSSAPLRSSWICCKRAMARSMVDVLTRLKSCILTKCKRKFRHRLRRMMWAPRFSVNSMMAWCIWLSAIKLQKNTKEQFWFKVKALCALCSHTGGFCGVTHTRASSHAGSTASSPPSLPRWHPWTRLVAASKRRNRLKWCCHTGVSLSSIVPSSHRCGLLPEPLRIPLILAV